MSWLRISLDTSGELAEAVAEVLGRYAPGGVAVEAPQPDLPGLPAPGRAQVTAYLPLDELAAGRRRAIEEGLWHLAQIVPIPSARFDIVDSQDWAETWRERYRPIPIGDRLIIVPSWLEPPASARLPLLLEPGMAFGTGTHPSTQMCLLAMEKHLRPGARLIDLGCGSGILAIAAVKLGAGNVLALDIDPLAVEATRDNCHRNGVADQVQVEAGSLAYLLDRAYPPADLLIANILAPVLSDMLDQGLGQAVTDGGIVVLSGILAEQLPRILDQAAASSLELVEILQSEDWRTPVFSKATGLD